MYIHTNVSTYFTCLYAQHCFNANLSSESPQCATTLRNAVTKDNHISVCWHFYVSYTLVFMYMYVCKRFKDPKPVLQLAINRSHSKCTLRAKSLGTATECLLVSEP